jgi:ribosomal protein S18 acetylase RimI-like enzyme
VKALTIRAAEPDEFAEAGRITLDAYAALFGDDDLGDYRSELLDVERRARAGVVLVAVDDDALLGTVTYVPGPGTELSEFDDPDGCGIRMLAVDPRHQGRGAGRALTTACIELGRSQGRRRVLLHSTVAMAVARAMYEGMGFVRAPSRDVEIDRDGEEPFLLVAYEYELADGS